MDYGLELVKIRENLIKYREQILKNKDQTKDTKEGIRFGLQVAINEINQVL